MGLLEKETVEINERKPSCGTVGYKLGEVKLDWGPPASG